MCGQTFCRSKTTQRKEEIKGRTQIGTAALRFHKMPHSAGTGNRPCTKNQTTIYSKNLAILSQNLVITLTQPIHQKVLTEEEKQTNKQKKAVLIEDLGL